MFQGDIHECSSKLELLSPDSFLLNVNVLGNSNPECVYPNKGVIIPCYSKDLDTTPGHKLKLGGTAAAPQAAGNTVFYLGSSQHCHPISSDWKQPCREGPAFFRMRGLLSSMISVWACRWHITENSNQSFNKNEICNSAYHWPDALHTPISSSHNPIRQLLEHTVYKETKARRLHN